jgi:hypothetical protein
LNTLKKSRRITYWRRPSAELTFERLVIANKNIDM